MDWIQANLKDDIDFVVWTGDTARHDSDEDYPRRERQVLGSNRIVANMFVDVFSGQHSKLDIPVVPTLGNNDFLPHNIFYPGPNEWLMEYGDIWRRFIPEEQMHSFKFGGWFYVEVIPHQLAVFSLNTMYFFDRNAAVDGCAEPSEPGFQHMEWLRVQLQSMRARGMKAILMGHVPPARTKSKQNWDETCWQKYTLWLQQFRDVVTGSVYGHMNIDHFLLQDTKDVESDLGVSRRKEYHPEEEMAIESKQDYLLSLRDVWADLPDSVMHAFSSDQADGVDASKKKKKKKKLKKIGGKYGERYQLSLVSPSVVPNYLPTIRVIEYNITGLESAAVWTDSFDESSIPASSSGTTVDEVDDVRQELRRDLEADRKKRKDRKSKPKDGSLAVPDGPPKKALPGPAYFPQTLSFTGYTQYFANLTHINNVEADVEGVAGELRSRSSGPRKFKYEVEYSTFDDKIYKLKDLTVLSYLKLAYRMGQDKSKADAVTVDQTTGLETAKESSKKHKKKNKKNKAWLHFLGHAFVQTIPKDELEQL